MALAHFQRTFTDTQGNVKPELSVTIRRESDNGLAALFTNAAGSTSKSNPFNTDASGFGDFYVTDGRYRVQATDIDLRNEDLVSQPSPNFGSMPQVGGDPIVESGSNADGEWTRWADGTQAVYGKVRKSINIDVNIVFGSFFRNSSGEALTNLPLNFFDTNYVLNVVRHENNPTDPVDYGVFQVFPSTIDTFRFFLLSETSQTAADRSYSFHAIGRWK